MGRKPLYGKAMTPTERKRRWRQAAASAPVRAQRIRRAFEAAGADAQDLFMKWLRSRHHMN
jgi:hypothetical protein